MIMKNNILTSISVFCGSSPGNNDLYYQEAYHLGVFLAESNIKLVYGGAKVGLMGAVADGALSKGGTVVGVIPDFLLNKEIAHDGLTELKVVQSMHQRKSIMDELSDGSIILPGGFGTMDEMFELLTWGQLGLHKKPIGILNTDGFYDDLIACLDKMVLKNLLRQTNRDMLLVSQDIITLFGMMKTYEAPMKANLMNRDEV